MQVTKEQLIQAGPGSVCKLQRGLKYRKQPDAEMWNQLDSQGNIQPGVAARTTENLARNMRDPVVHLERPPR
jgi:hypothetical protein